MQPDAVPPPRSQPAPAAFTALAGIRPPHSRGLPRPRQTSRRPCPPLRRTPRTPPRCQFGASADDAGVPAAFGDSEWPAERAHLPLDVDIGAFCIPQSAADGDDSGTAAPAGPGYLTSPSSFACVDHLSSPQRAAFLSTIRASACDFADRNLCQGVDARLRAALRAARAGVATSALLVEFSPDRAVMRAAWAGVCGLLVIRDRSVLFRTYRDGSPREELECALRRDVEAAARDGAGGGVQSGFFPLTDGDLVLAGSQILFSNLSELQMLSFVRPVVDSYDATLAIANATCIGTWRTDDVHFVSYMLAHLAHTFATSPTAKQLTAYPFPPGTEGAPFFDGDLTVIAASCSYAR